MSLSAEFGDYVAELLAPLGRVRLKRMFGGAGIYVDEVFIAIVVDDVLYLKVDDENQARFEAAGSSPFVYEAKGRRVVMSFWRAPDEAMDSPALMHDWARGALAAALRGRQAPAQKSGRRTKKTP